MRGKKKILSWSPQVFPTKKKSQQYVPRAFPTSKIDIQRCSNGMLLIFCAPLHPDVSTSNHLIIIYPSSWGLKVRSKRNIRSTSKQHTKSLAVLGVECAQQQKHFFFDWLKLAHIFTFYILWLYYPGPRRNKEDIYFFVFQGFDHLIIAFVMLTRALNIMNLIFFFLFCFYGSFMHFTEISFAWFSLLLWLMAAAECFSFK